MTSDDYVFGDEEVAGDLPDLEDLPGQVEIFGDTVGDLPDLEDLPGQVEVFGEEEEEFDDIEGEEEDEYEVLGEEEYDEDEYEVLGDHEVESPVVDYEPSFDFEAPVEVDESADPYVLGLGEVTSRSPAFRQYAAERAAQSEEGMLRGIPLNRLRDMQLDFGPASAPAGQELTFTNAPQCIFRGEKVIATDTSSTPGTGTRIKSISVGAMSQRPSARGGTLTRFFGESALGNGILWDTAYPGLTIAVVVSFITACTFEMTVFGHGVM